MFSVVLCPLGEYDTVLHKSRISEQAGPEDVLFVVHIIVSLITSIALISFHFRTFTFWFFIRASCTCSFHRILTSFLGGFFLLCPVFFLLGFITCSFNDKNESKPKKSYIKQTFFLLRASSVRIHPVRDSILSYMLNFFKTILWLLKDTGHQHKLRDLSWGIEFGGNVREYRKQQSLAIWKILRWMTLTWALFAALLMPVKSFAKESKYLKCWQFVCLLSLCPFSFSPLNVARILQPIHYGLLHPLKRMFFCQQQWGKSVYRAHRISPQAWPLLQTVEHNDSKVIRHDGTMDA